MVNLQKSGDSAVKFVFTDSDHYLYGNGEIEVPVNSLLLVIDESDMVTFKKLSGDPFLSFRADNSNLGTKAAIEQFYKDNMVGSTGGGGSESGITSGEVQTMIDESISGKADASALTVHADNANVHFSGTQKSNYDGLEAQYYVDDNWDVMPMSVFNDFTNDYSTAMGQFDQRITANASAIATKADTSAVTAVANDVQTVSGQVQTKVATSDFNAYSAATATALGNKQDKLQYYGEDTEQWEEEDGDTPDSTAVFTQKQSDILTDDFGDEGSSQAGVQSRVYTVKFNGVLDTGQSESSVDIFANEASNDTEYGSSINVSDNGVGIRASFMDYNDEFGERLASIDMNNNDVSISLASTANGDSTAMVINTSGVTINNENVATEPYVDAAISGKADTSAVTQVNNALTAHTANTTVHVSQVEKAAWNAKVDTSAITTSVTSASTDTQIPTAKAVYDATQSGGGGMDDDTQQLISTAFNDLNDRKADLTELSKYQKKGDYVETPTLADYMANASFDEYATAKERIISGALNDLNNKFGGLRLVKISQADYDNLATKDENTLYIINNVI